MAEHPCPRRWFQLHLITCICLMLVASAMVCLNVRPQYYGYPGYRDRNENIKIIDDATVDFRWGWPWMMNRDWRMDGPLKIDITESSLTEMVESQNFSGHEVDAEVLKRVTDHTRPFTGVWYPYGIVGNAAAAFAVLFFTAFFIELVLRKRASSKLSPTKPS